MDRLGRQKNTSSQSVRARLCWVCAWALIRAMKRVSDERSRSKICINGGGGAWASLLSWAVAPRPEFCCELILRPHSRLTLHFLWPAEECLLGGTSRWTGALQTLFCLNYMHINFAQSVCNLCIRMLARFALTGSQFRGLVLRPAQNSPPASLFSPCIMLPSGASAANCCFITGLLHK